MPDIEPFDEKMNDPHLLDRKTNSFRSDSNSREGRYDVGFQSGL